MLSHVCSAGAMHDNSSMMVSSTGMARAMQISALKMDQWFDGGDGL
jgi:hypothetical protein